MHGMRWLSSHTYPCTLLRVVLSTDVHGRRRPRSALRRIDAKGKRRGFARAADQEFHRGPWRTSPVGIACFFTLILSLTLILMVASASIRPSALWLPVNCLIFSAGEMHRSS